MYGTETNGGDVSNPEREVLTGMPTGWHPTFTKLTLSENFWSHRSVPERTLYVRHNGAIVKALGIVKYFVLTLMCFNNDLG